MDALVPMACLPVAMSGRNWMLRRMLTQSIRNDPDWMGGNYTKQPPNMQRHLLTYALATIGGNQALYRQAPDYEKGDALIAQRLAAPFRGDANDTLYQWESSADYDPSPAWSASGPWCSRSTPPTTSATRRNWASWSEAMKRVKNGRYVLFQGGPDTRGHGTTGMAKLWKQHLAELLQTAPRR